MAKHVAETKISRGGPNPLPRHPRHGNRFIRFVLPLLFMISIAAIVFGVMTFLKHQGKEPTNGGPLKAPTARKILPDDTFPQRNSAKPDDKNSQSMPVPPAEKPSVLEPPPELPNGIEPQSPDEAAMEVLEKFLAAKTLAERLPLIESHTAEADLAKTCLAGPLPATIKIENYSRETNTVEQVVDIYHNVNLDAGNNRTNPQTILVRTRGSGDPKIVVDPFLDSFGGRLMAYAKTPSDKAGIFQVIINPVAACYDERVPNREKKLTLKLLPQDNAKEIALACFGRQSKIGLMLEDGTYSLRYGKAKACTVMLRWNTEDKPSMPYLEALDLKTLDWNP